ncbi:MAG TPA: hypothetical protein VMT89_01890 [Candidatus Acidoferrales bacterium]|nr:hypothetical protein [Candidatus Acidoferrales bacterium]
MTPGATPSFFGSAASEMTGPGRMSLNNGLNYGLNVGAAALPLGISNGLGALKWAYDNNKYDGMVGQNSQRTNFGNRNPLIQRLLDNVFSSGGGTNGAPASQQSYDPSTVQSSTETANSSYDPGAIQGLLQKIFSGVGPAAGIGPGNGPGGPGTAGMTLGPTNFDASGWNMANPTVGGNAGGAGFGGLLLGSMPSSSFQMGDMQLGNLMSNLQQANKG